MTRDQWQRVKTVLAGALDRPERDRLAYVAEACAGNEALEREVRSLLSSAVEASRLFETQALTFSPRAPDRFPVGSLINGRYMVDGIAGEGGMGDVYRVTDTARGRTLALKTIRGQTRFVNLFKIEFRTLVELRHPHLARSYDFEPIAGSTDYCFTMDYVEGANIFDATTGLPWRDVLDLLVQMCRALAYVHNRGVVHRDIKPNNVLVTTDRTVKIVDFGLAGGQGDGEGLIGTPAYLAPELMSGGQGDHRCDLYSLGILAYQLLCRTVPFSSPDVADVLHQHAYSPLKWPGSVDVPAWLQEIVGRLSAKLPADRFRSANQVIEAVNDMGALDYPVETAATKESYVLSGRFVGRDDELRALSNFAAQRLGDNEAGLGPMALISGHAGVGKSRLVGELRHELQLSRLAFVEGNCFEGAAAEYGAMAEALAQLVPLVESRGGFELIERCASELVKVAPDVGRTRTVIPSSPLTTAEAEQRRLLDTIAEFVTGATSLFPFVLYINDLQWAPQGTIEILRYVQRRIAIAERGGERLPMALLGSFRDDEIAGRPIEHLLEETGEGAGTIRLEPLAPRPMERLLGSMFGLDDIPRSFVSRVLDEAAGSPFFLEEVVRALVENGSVFVEHGSWRTTSSIGELEIPPTVMSALRRRVAMIDAPEQVQILELLAAYKKPMSVPLLSAISGRHPEEIELTIHALSTRQMVASSGGREPAYRTAHDHLRTTVYEDLGSRARDVHGLIAHGLEHMAGGGERLLSELAHHYWLAQEQDPALAYALRAGSAALAVYANEEAIEHLEHALELLPHNHSEELMHATEQLADAHFLAGHYRRAQSLLTVVDSGVRRTIDKTRVQRKLGEVVGYSAGKPHEAADIMWRAAELLGARRPASRAAFTIGTLASLGRHFLQQSVRPLVPAARDESERTRLTELAGIYLRIGYFNFFGDPLLLFLPVFRAANVIDRVGEGKEHSHVYSMTAVALAGLGFPERALRYGEDAIAEAGRSGSPWHVANAQSFHAIVLLQTGHWSQALERAEHARAGFAACGDHFQLAVAAYHLLEVLHARGKLQDAAARGREELAVFERLGLQMIGKGPFTVFGRILAKMGDAEGIAVGQDVLALAEQGSDKLSTVFAHMALGDSLLHLGRVDEAIDHLERGLAIRDRDRFDVYVVAEGSALLAQAYGARMRAGGVSYTGGARRSFDRRVSQAAAAGRRFPPMRSAARLVRGLQHRFRRELRQAAACFEQAAALAEAQGAALWRADAHFEWGLALFEAEGRGSLAGAAQLELALTLYRACHAAPSENRVVAALAGTHMR